MGGQILVVAGGQFGSEGKGAVTAALGVRLGSSSPVVGVRVAGPNAGHTVVGKCPPGCLPDETNHVVTARVQDSVVIDATQHLWKLRSVPVLAVSNPQSMLVIAAGSEVDKSVLDAEVSALDSAGYQVSDRLVIDKSATLLKAHHIFDEQQSDLVKRLGSTAKGIGAARADRIWRTAELYGGYSDTVPMLYTWLRQGATIIIEGTQGFGLGTHAGSYPQCTSSDCRAIDFLSMAGLSPWHDSVDQIQVWLAARVRPIRVAGNSGPLKGETTWQDLGLPEERTTVTNKVRRVGEWDGELVRNAIEENGGRSVNLALTMVDTVFPYLAQGRGTLSGLADNPEDKFTDEQLTKFFRFLADIEHEVGTSVSFVGTGPQTGVFS